MRRYQIGRSDTNEIAIADASVSRHHAELAELGDGRFTLKDLGSTYGTHVWADQRWVPAADTEIRADTVIRFGEFQTTLMDVLSEAQRAALGLPTTLPASPPPAEAPGPAVAPAAATPISRPAPAAPREPPVPHTQAPQASAAPPVAAAPVAAAPVATASPSKAAPAGEATAPRTVPPASRGAVSGEAAPSLPTPPPSARAGAEPRPAARPAGRARPGQASGRRKSMMLGLLGLAIFAALAAVVVAAVLLFGDANPPPRPDAPPTAGNAEAPSRMLAACVKEWEVPERRCHCFLSAAGPHLLAEDYDDFAEMMEAYVSGDTDRQESALQRATEKRGAPASSRLTAAFKGAVRDCQQ